MNAITLEQTLNYLTRHVQRWDRRLRLLHSVVWGPRLISAGMVFGITIAIIARLRPWLMPEQIVLHTALFTLALVIGGLGVIWLWPRPVPRRARHFDYRFDLKERVSTALELARGVIHAPEIFVDRQIDDAVRTADHVHVRSYLPLRVRFFELVILAVLIGFFAWLLVLPNPQTDELRAQQELQEAIDAQAAEVQNAIEEIEANPDLNDAQREALTQPLDQALDTLQQPDISQPEAMAALAEAQQELNDLADGMMPDQERAYQEAANELAGGDMTNDLAQAMNDADLGQTANELDDLAERMDDGQLAQDELDALAQQLDDAAEKLDQTNPALAEEMREAADALRDGDVETAQEALQEAADLLREQEASLADSPLAEAAQEAAQELAQNMQELANPGQQMPAPDDAQPQPNGGQQDAQPGDPQQGQPAQMPDDMAGQQGGQEPQQQGQPADGQGEPGQNGGAPSGQDAAGEAGQPQAGDGDGDGQAADADMPPDATGAGEGAAAPAAGAGEGGQGVDDVQGQGDANDGQTPPQAAPDGDFEAYTPEYDPTNLGGDGDVMLDVGGDADDPGDGPGQEIELGPNPEGEAQMTYTGAFQDFQDIVTNALESGRIPMDQRDVIHDYFSSLDR